MCSQSISGSSLLSGYDEDNLHETSGRSRREFEQIDAVLYGEDASKRSSIKKVCEEWSNKPHFRVRGRSSHIDHQQNTNYFKTTINISSATDLLSNNIQIFNFNSNDLTISTNGDVSGRSSINSIEGSQLNNDSDLDDGDVTNLTFDDRLSDAAADSFDTDDDDDEHSSNRTIKNRSKHPQSSITCLKDTIITSLTVSLFKRFLNEEQSFLQSYARSVCDRNSVKLRRKNRPSSSPSRSSLLNRHTLMTPSTILSNSSNQQTPLNANRPIPGQTGNLGDILHVKRIYGPNNSSNPNVPVSPRKSQTILTFSERASTSLAIEKRNQQQISLVGTAVPNLSLQISTSTPQSSQNPIRQTSSTVRHRSATITNSNIQNLELPMRLPPIPTDRFVNNDQLFNNRSNSLTPSVVEAIPPTTRAASGISYTSNISTTAKLRSLTAVGKFQRSTRPITISSSKDLHNTLTTNPIRSLTAIPSGPLKITAAIRTHQQSHH